MISDILNPKREHFFVIDHFIDYYSWVEMTAFYKVHFKKILVLNAVSLIFVFRVRMLSVCTLVFGIAIILSGGVNEYWQLVLLRMIMAAGESGCNPLATGILSDIFPEEKRALVMSVFNWGIYGGYGKF